MHDLIGEIDRNHVTYRQRAVQRAQFMLLSDGSTQGKISDLLRYYAETVKKPEELFEPDESPLSHQWKLYPVEIMGKHFLKPAVSSRKPTPIEQVPPEPPISQEELQRQQELLMDVKEIANYLLNHCFLPVQAEEMREKHYYAVNHLEELRRVFKPLGYTVVYHTAPLKVIALVNEFEGNQARLNKYESILLLIFRLLYLQKREKLSVDGEHVTVTVREIQDEFQKLNLPRKLDRPTLEGALRTLKNYNLARPLDRLSDENAKIEIYPTVILALPDNVLKASRDATMEELNKYRKAGEEEDT